MYITMVQDFMGHSLCFKYLTKTQSL